MTGREQSQHVDNLSEAPHILVLGQHLNKEVISEPNAMREQHYCRLSGTQKV